MNKRPFLFVVLSTIVFISACSTIVTGTDQTVTFNSEPDGATVTVAGLAIGKTPLSTKIDKGKNQAVTFEKEGYKTFTTKLSTTTNAWFFGNILIGGLLGSTTDGVSGAIHEFSPDQYFVTLTPETPFGLSTSKPRKIKELIIAYGAGLRSELASNGGETTDAILNLLEVGEEQKATTIAALKQLSINNKNDLDFANSIIEIYDVK